MTRLAFLIPASPNDAFCSQIAMFRMALDHLGGIYRDARVVVVFGDAEVTAVPARWRSEFTHIEVHFVRPELFLAKKYRAQSDARWQVVPPDCDFAIFTNADIAVIRRFDELVLEPSAPQAVAGTIAHIPFPQQPGEDPRATWATLGKTYCGGELPLDYVHTLTTAADPDARRRCPFYVNYGFVVVGRQLVDELGPDCVRLSEELMPQLRFPYFAGQIALTLAVYRHGVERHAIDMRYNFPNDPLAEELYSDEITDIRVLHFLRTHHFDRHQIFVSDTAFEAFLRLDLSGSERVLQDHVRHLTGGRYPF